MTNIANLSKKTLVVLNSYHRIWRRRLWQAFHAEHVAFGKGGREKFADFINDTIIEASKVVRVTLPDGTPYQSHQNTRSAETYRNFLEAGLKTKDGWIAGRETSLQRIHLFLWIRKPEVVESWADRPSDLEPSEFVDGIDELIRVLDVQDALPEGLRFYWLPPEARRHDSWRMRDTYALNIHYFPENFEDKQRNGSPRFELYGITFWFLDDNQHLRTFYFSSEEWNTIQEIFNDKSDDGKPNETFHFVGKMRPEGSLLCEDRRLAIRESNKKPAIINDYYVWIIRSFDRLKSDYHFEKIENLLINSMSNIKEMCTLWMSDNYIDIMDAHLNYLKIGDDTELILSPLKEEDLKLKKLLTRAIF